MSYPRDFPIMDPNGEPIPWALLAQHEDQAVANHGQSLAVLARRGGLSWCEALAVLEDRPWRKMHAHVARPLVLSRVERFAGEPRSETWMPLDETPDGH
jgi:hypothetical protein